MSRRARTRKAYAPRPVHLNAVERAMQGAAKLPAAEVARIKVSLTLALQAFGRGEDCVMHWMTMADALNVAEGLADVGICSDDASRERVTAGQAALAEVSTRHRERNAWTLYATERQALDDALWLHGVQLDNCSFHEYERAVSATVDRIRQARAGNAPRGAIVVEGAIA